MGSCRLVPVRPARRAIGTIRRKARVNAQRIAMPDVQCGVLQRRAPPGIHQSDTELERQPRLALRDVLPEFLSVDIVRPTSCSATSVQAGVFGVAGPHASAAVLLAESHAGSLQGRENSLWS